MTQTHDSVVNATADRIGSSLDAGWQLPASLYADPAVFALERDRVFARSWQYAGLERDVAAPGAYITAQIGDVPVVVVRDKDGVLHGHVNICRHRLHPVAEGSGCKQLFQCRYHGWTFRHDGSLRSAPGLQEEDAFDRQTLGLRPIAVDVLNGVVLVNLDAAAEPLRDYLGHDAVAAADKLESFTGWDHAGQFTYEIDANWKLFVENSLECYHCPLVHENTYSTVFETSEKFYLCEEFEHAATQIAAVTQLTEDMVERSGFDEATGFHLFYLWPVTFMSVDDFVGIVAHTVAVDATTTRFVVDAFVRPGTDPQVLAEWLDVYDRTFAEDKIVVAAQQAGYNAGVVTQGRLMTNRESTIAMFQKRTWQAVGSALTLSAPQANPSSRSVSTVDTTPHSPAADSPAKPPIGRRSHWEADVTVETVTTEAEGVVSLTLSAAAGDVLPAWTPGAHIDVCMTEDLTRQYSLCGDPRTADRWQIAVLEEPASRGGSQYVHRQISAGQTIRVRGPRNNFPLPEAPAYRFVAGGIGITPILPMLRDAEARGIPWRLLYGGRTLTSMAFLDDLGHYGDAVTVWPQDTHGHPDLSAFLADAPAGSAVMACGPTGLLDAITAVCDRHPTVDLHIERFVAATQLDLPTTAFDVLLARSGTTVHVDPDQSILDAVRAEGVPVLSSCREGVCGTCETAVIDGTPQHRDNVLTDEERDAGDTMLICVSRCAGDRLVLDL